MSTVNLEIAGRSYAVACADGEEAHIIMLGQMIDGKITAIGDSGHNESRGLLFAALLLADELHESKGSAGLSGASPQPASAFDSAKLGDIALRLENIAAALEA